MKKQKISTEESLYLASQWQLMWRKLRKHKLALVGAAILVLFYLVAIFCEFFSPHDIFRRYAQYPYSPPQRVRFFDEEMKFHLRPFVYGLKRTTHPVSFRRTYSVDKKKVSPIYFFVRGDEYKLWNLFPMDIHLFGVKEGTLFLFGTAKLGRDLFSRILYASRISLSIGLVGVAFSFVLGCIFG